MKGKKTKTSIRNTRANKIYLVIGRITTYLVGYLLVEFAFCKIIIDILSINYK